MAAVVFDFDGVLADTERLHLRAFQHAFAPRGWVLDETTYFERYLGYDDAGLVEAYARDGRLTLGQSEVSVLLAAKSRAFRELIASGSVLFPEAPDCVARLAPRFSLAIASGALHAEITDILTGAGLLPSFRAVVGADDVERSKPAPDSYLKAAELLGVSSRDCVAVEDSRWGLEAAKGAGMCTVGVTSTFAAPDLGDADHVVADLSDLTVDLVDALVRRPDA